MTTATTPGSCATKAIPHTARYALQLLEKLQHGVLTMHLPDGSCRYFGAHQAQQAPNKSAHFSASITLHNWNVFAAALKSGDIGFAESYIAGDWTSPHLPELLKLLSSNRQAIDAMVFGTWYGRLLYRIKHLLHHNSRRNSRKNIHAHYDLGNAFYQLWLDPTMNYSGALYEGDYTRPIAQAQTAKVQRALRMAGVKSGSRVLEIGCGWGALAEEATRQFNANVVGVTLSTEQLSYATTRLQNLGIATGQDQQADLRLQDYRDIADPPFDAICSIEMVEAVGQSYWPDYFNTVHKLLKPGARACIQSIVIRDDLFERYAASTDFIQQYIFPGGCLPSLQQFRRQAEQAGLQVLDTFSFGSDYAQTLREWRNAFVAQKEHVLKLGFDTRFTRIWEFYLAYCEAAFDTGDINLMQFTLFKPE